MTSKHRFRLTMSSESTTRCPFGDGWKERSSDYDYIFINGSDQTSTSTVLCGALLEDWRETRVGGICFPPALSRKWNSTPHLRCLRICLWPLPHRRHTDN